MMNAPYLHAELQLTVGGAIVTAVAVAGFLVAVWTSGWCAHRWVEARRRRRNIRI